MAGLDYQRMIIGYHGCDARVVSDILTGTGTLAPSENDHDWLGRGIYFWEHGPRRAHDWADDERRRAPGKIQAPAILGAYIHLGECFDLLDTANTLLLRRMHPQFRRFIKAAGKPMPENAPLPGTRAPDRILRRLDCAMINWSLDEFAKSGRVYQTVRGVFVEGQPAYPGAKIMAKSHIQIAVRDERCIVGYFRPNPRSQME